MKQCKDCKWWKIVWAHGQTFAFDMNNKAFKKMVKKAKGIRCKPWMGMRKNNANRCENYHRIWWKFGMPKQGINT